MSHHKKKAVVLLTIDPTSPNETIIGYDASFDSPAFSPVGCSGADVLAALLNAGFYIKKVVAGDTFVQYTLINKHYDHDDRKKLKKAFEDLDCEPVS